MKKMHGCLCVYHSDDYDKQKFNFDIKINIFYANDFMQLCNYPMDYYF